LGFHTWQFGASVGGPIIEDKLHFFVVGDFQDRSSAFGNQFQLTGDPAMDMMRAGFTTVEAQRFIDILANKYGVTGAGDAFAPNLSNPDRNVFGKLNWVVDDVTRAEFSYNFVKASQDVLTRAPTSTTVPGRLRDGYELSDSGYAQANTTNTGRLKLTSNWANVSNELLSGFSAIRDNRDLSQILPLILVKVGTIGAADSWLAAGGERFSHQNLLDQDIFQLQDNVSFGFPGHRLTVGTSNEFLRIKNVFFQAAYGVWAFNSLDDFQNGIASAFQRRFGVSDKQPPGTANFNVTQLGLYVQDEWTPIKNLTI